MRVCVSCLLPSGVSANENTGKGRGYTDEAQRNFVRTPVGGADGHEKADNDEQCASDSSCVHAGLLSPKSSSSVWPRCAAMSLMADFEGLRLPIAQRYTVNGDTPVTVDIL